MVGGFNVRWPHFFGEAGSWDLLSTEVHETSKVAETNKRAVLGGFRKIKSKWSWKGKYWSEEGDIPLSVANLNDRSFTSETF
jgi:hypothetical protein